MRRSLSLALAAVVFGFFIAAAWFWFSNNELGPSDPTDARQVAMGRTIYATHCASCHGDNLQGEPNWSQRKANGRLPAPPHDATGHTSNHTDRVLFAMVKNGVAPYAPRGYQTDMPAFGKTLTDDEILAVLAYIKSSWPEDFRQRQMHLTEHAERGP